MHSENIIYLLQSKIAAHEETNEDAMVSELTQIARNRIVEFTLLNISQALVNHVKDDGISRSGQFACIV